MHKRRGGRPVMAALWGERTGSERMCTEGSCLTAHLTTSTTNFLEE